MGYVVVNECKNFITAWPMKLLVALLALSAWGAARWLPPAATVAKAAAATRKERKAKVPPQPSGLAMLREHDLALLLQARHPPCKTCAFRPLNGFYGPSRYRIELAMLQLTRDARQPTLYHVQGKSRYKKVIRPFSGTITLAQVVKQPEYSAREIAASSDWDQLENLPNMYTAIGQYELREASTQRGAGVYCGTVALDFRVEENGQVVQKSRHGKTLTQGGELKYAGTWTSNATSRNVPVTWVGNFLSYRGPQGFSDFNIGDRGISINPKYAHLGWNNFWENDEWWVDAPPASARL